MTTIVEAKQYLRDNWEAGVKCPCCSQLVKLYKYKLGYGMAKSAVDIYKLQVRGGAEWVHVQQALRPRNGDYAKLRHWGLLESDGEYSEDGNNSGLWRLTALGIEFAENKVTVPSHAYLFDSRRVSFSDSVVDIEQALGKQFNYNELMRGE